MMTDYKILGEVKKEIVGAGTYTATAGEYMVLRSIQDTAITTFVSAFANADVSGTKVSAFTALAGAEILGIKSLVITSGVAQIFWIK